MIKNFLILIFIFSICCFEGYAQSADGIGGPESAAMVFSESNLPIVVINTNGQSIADEPKKIVNMSIINNPSGMRNHLSDPASEYNGKIAIEIRGSSSQQFPKKSYGFETRDNTGNNKVDVSLFGMSPEHDWVLSANYTDKSFCRNVLAYQLSREMGHYAANTKYVELVINGTHMGIYVFMERVKRDPGRVDISSLHPNETTPPDITGGYIIKVDKTTGSGGTGWTSAYPPINHANNQKTFIQYDYPSPDSLAASQKAYIKSYVDSFENALSGPNFRDSVNGYPRFIGNSSWIDYFFCNELSKNVDGYRISSYLYKDKNKQLKAGPVWDYDIAWGNANYCSGNDTTGWAYLFPCTGDGYQIPFWWQKLLLDTNYTNEMKCRWSNSRQNVLSESHIFSIIDSIALKLNESKDWNFAKWPILGTYVWPNPSPQPSTYAGEIQNLKNWVHRRLIWMDSNIPGRCACSVTASVINVPCNNSCDGKAVALGASSYKKTYEWSNGIVTDTISFLCPGTYSLTMKDKIGCSRTASVIIPQSSLLNVSSTKQNTNCLGNGCSGSASVSVSGGSSPYTYSWNTGQSSSNISSLCLGVYTVTVTDNHGCSKTSAATIQNPNAPVISLVNNQSASCHGASNGSASVTVSGGIGGYNYSWLPIGGNSSTASGLRAGTYTVNVTDGSGCIASLSVTINEPAALSINASVTNAVCNGLKGSASAAVTGGTAPYIYSWQPAGISSASIDSVSPGQYTVFVTDQKGCTSSSLVNISEPGAIAITASTFSPSCYAGNNGRAEVNVTGGTGNYHYVWSSGDNDPSAENLSAGIYTVTISDASNCSAESSVLVIDPPAISLSTNSTTATCGLNDGTASVSVTNGTLPYSYHWIPSGVTNASASNLNPGNHTAVVTDANGCIASDTIEIQSASGLNITVSGRTEVSCAGSSDADITLIVSGGSAPYNYSWATPGFNASAANLSAGLYSVSITESNGCMTAYQFSITEPAPLTLNVNSTSAFCYGSATGSLNANVSGGTAPYSYSWPGSNNQSLMNVSAGQYTVVVTDANGCTISNVSTVNQPLPISANITAVDASCGLANGSVQIIAAGGSGNYRYLWSTGDTTSFVSDISSGSYFVTTFDLNNCSSLASVLVGGSAKPEILISSINDVTCSGGDNGSAALSINGGTGTMNYSWTPSVSNNSSANNLTAGVYSVVVSDNLQCRDSIGFIVNQPAPLAALMFSENVTCFGDDNGILFADAGGGTRPYTYLWSNGQVNDSAIKLSIGNYSVLISDANNCTTSASGNINGEADISINFFIQNASCQSCLDGAINGSVTGGVYPYTYDWSLGNHTTSISNLAAGTYTLCVKDAAKCIKCSEANVISNVVGVQEIKRNNGVYVYPNPMNQSAIFAFTLNAKQSVDIIIYSAAGQRIKEFVHQEMEAGEHLLNFNSSDLTPGIYFYQFKISTHVQTGTLVVHH